MYLITILCFILLCFVSALLCCCLLLGKNCAKFGNYFFMSVSLTFNLTTFYHFARSHFYSQVFNVCVSFNMYIYFLVFVIFFLFVCMYIPIIQPAEREKIVARVTQVDKVFFRIFFYFKYFCLWECVCVYLLLLAWIYKCSVVCVSNKTCFWKRFIFTIFTVCVFFLSFVCRAYAAVSKEE